MPGKFPGDNSPGNFVYAALFAVVSTGASIVGTCIASTVVEGLEENGRILQIALSVGTMAADLLFTDSDGIGINRMHEGVRGLFSTALGIGTCMVFLQRLSIWVSVLAAAVSAANALLNFWDNSYVRRNRDQWAGADKKLSYLNRRLTEKEYGMDIRAYHCIDWLREKFGEAIRERGKWQERILEHQAAAQCYQMRLTLLYNGAVLVYIVWSVLTGRISVSEFVLYTGLIAQLAGFYDRMLGAFNNLTAGSRDVQVIRE